MHARVRSIEIRKRANEHEISSVYHGVDVLAIFSVSTLFLTETLIRLMDVHAPSIEKRLHTYRASSYHRSADQDSQDEGTAKPREPCGLS